MEGLFFLVFLIILVVIIINLFAPTKNRSQIEEAISKNGGHVEQIDWKMFGKDSAMDKYSNYVVTYKDKYGNIKRATVKTMMGRGVYFGNEETLLEATDTSKPASTNNETLAPTHLNFNDWNSVDKLQDEVRRLELENAELKKRVEKLEKGA